ncbi:hypothetical protein GCM10008967_14960 [Bacillus carboniphilus]|uniref:Uncharacterized protein n=1 Tax=Bacillus carboniphilus TaxID=86663 RepID=A0ABN0W522_9BACI
MRKLWEVKEKEWKAGNLYLQLETSPSLQNVKAGERMLAHSDELSFIYILEQDDEFIYLALPSSIWADLKMVMSDHSKVLLKGSEGVLELASFEMELEYLIQNIEGNSNYGDEMVKEVEKVFL